MMYRQETNPKVNNLLMYVSVFMVFFWVFNDFGIRYIYGYALLVVLLVWQGIKMVSRGDTFRVNKFKVLFTALVVLSTFFSLLPTSNYNNFTFAITISMLVFWMYALFASVDKNQVLRVFRYIRLMSFVLSIYIIAVKLFPAIYWDHIFHYLSAAAQDEANRLMHLGYGVPIGASSTYADYLIMVGILTIFGEFVFMTKKGDTKRKIASGLKLTVFFAAMLVENRRTEVLSMILTVAIIFVLLINPRNHRDFSKKFTLFLKLIALVPIVIAVCWQIGLLERFAHTFTTILSGAVSVNELSSGRTDLWRVAWELFKENPILGIGWEQFINHNYYNHEVHNSYLQFLCETGVIGFVGIVTPILGIVFASLSQLKRLTRKNEEVLNGVKALNVVGSGIQVFFFLVNFIDPAFYHQNFFCFYGFSIILLSYCLDTERELVANMVDGTRRNIKEKGMLP